MAEKILTWAERVAGLDRPTDFAEADAAKSEAAELRRALERTEAARVAAERAYERHIDVAIEVLKERDQLRAQMDRLQASFDRVNAGWLRQDKEIGELQRQLADAQQRSAKAVEIINKVSNWMNGLPIPTTGCTHQMMKLGDACVLLDFEDKAQARPQWPHPDDFGGGLMGEK
jgi:hypothetical protein